MQHVIIAGFGPVGRVLADALIKSEVPFTVIETNSTTVNSQRSLDRSVIHGDAADPAVLEAAGIGDASAVVITIPDPSTALRICQAARPLAPTAVIAIRTRHLSEALQAKQLGADIAVVEEIETAKAMTTAVTAALKPDLPCAADLHGTKAQPPYILRSIAEARNEPATGCDEAIANPQRPQNSSRFKRVGA